jgi:hypothetical protein
MDAGNLAAFVQESVIAAVAIAAEGVSPGIAQANRTGRNAVVIWRVVASSADAVSCLAATHRRGTGARASTRALQSLRYKGQTGLSRR